MEEVCCQLGIDKKALTILGSMMITCLDLRQEICAIPHEEVLSYQRTAAPKQQAVTYLVGLAPKQAKKGNIIHHHNLAIETFGIVDQSIYLKHGIRGGTRK